MSRGPTSWRAAFNRLAKQVQDDMFERQSLHGKEEKPLFFFGVWGGGGEGGNNKKPSTQTDVLAEASRWRTPAQAHPGDTAALSKLKSTLQRKLAKSVDASTGRVPHTLLARPPR